MKTAKYVDASELIPSDWTNWFWEEFSENAPFSWGENNLSLIAPEDFHAHACDVFGDIETKEGSKIPGESEFLKSILALGDTYINLEG